VRIGDIRPAPALVQRALALLHFPPDPHFHHLSLHLPRLAQPLLQEHYHRRPERRERVLLRILGFLLRALSRDRSAGSPASQSAHAAFRPLRQRDGVERLVAHFLRLREGFYRGVELSEEVLRLGVESLALVVGERAGGVVGSCILGVVVVVVVVSAVPGWRRGGEVGGAGGAQGAGEVCDAGVDAVGFLEEGVYALDVVGVGGDWGRVVGLEAGVEVGGYVGHGFCGVWIFVEFLFLVRAIVKSWESVLLCWHCRFVG